MFAVVLATQSATLQLNSHSFNVPPGFSQYSIPMAGGDAMKATPHPERSCCRKSLFWELHIQPEPSLI